MKTGRGKVRGSGFSAVLPLLIGACGLLVLGEPMRASDWAGRAEEMRSELARKVLPYWYDTAQDKERGGYLLADDLAGRGEATEKQLVSQSRMIWGFAHAHLKGFRDPDRDYLAAARQGYQFLKAHFEDKSNGGYYWKTDLAGRVTNDRKILYGQAFVLYALVEYHRASQEAEPLQSARKLYRVLQRRAHDRKNGGWLEHFQRDWTPILVPEPGAEVEVPGLKSANAHLHLMEALTELYDVTRNRNVRTSLREAVRLNIDYFYPARPGESSFHRELDWGEVTEPKSAGLSYGHNVEFAWLMVRAQQVLGQRPDWEHFFAHIDHALKYGWDEERGGLYERGVDDQPATQTDKVWWVQSEMLAALTDAQLHRPTRRYEVALEKLVEFVWKWQVNPADGIWLDTVAADGQPKRTGKAHNWKANYHDLRAMVKFIEAFGKPSAASRVEPKQ